jgi:type II secretory pathway pseudopilin PulG
MKAQTAFEYMVIAIIILAFLTPIWLYVSQSQRESAEQLSLTYAKNTVKKIVENADLVYSQRMGAKVKVGVYIPAGVEQVNITGKTVIIRVYSSSGSADIFETSMANLNGTLPAASGFHWVFIEAKGNYVQIGT